VTRRLFLGIPVPSEVHEFLEKLKDANEHVSGIKWMRLPNLHLTIYFIGNIKSEDFDLVKNTLLPVINSHKKFSIEFENIYFAPNVKPKMIWAKFHKNDSFTELSNSIHKALKSIIPENKFYYPEPVPHITLARFHPIKETESIKLLSSLDLSKIEINSCQLFESINTTEGVKYFNVAPVYYLKN
jgi:2'-5' RNA ligase